jgi:hypothetical protein
MTGPGSYSFNGLVNSVLLKVSITQQSGNTYTFQSVSNANLSGKLKPATVTLTIGNDTGTTSALPVRSTPSLATTWPSWSRGDVGTGWPPLAA